MIKRFLKDRRGIISEALPWIIISIAILVILMVSVFVMRGEGTSIIDKVKGLFKFR